MSELEDELRALSRTLPVAPPPGDLAERVLHAVRARRQRRRLARGWHWLTRTRRRLVAAVVAALVIGLALTPPVRAAVVEWLGIGGVLIKTSPVLPNTPGRPSEPASPGPLPSTRRDVSLEQARALVTFAVGVPEALGPPDSISVSIDRRVVSMDWGAGGKRVHLDQFDGTISWVFVKRTRSPVTGANVNGQDAVWLAAAHEIAYVDRSGQERSVQARISGPCLVWERPTAVSPVTLRLEGDLSLGRAVTVAESVR